MRRENTSRKLWMAVQVHGWPLLDGKRQSLNLILQSNIDTPSLHFTITTRTAALLLGTASPMLDLIQFKCLLLPWYGSPPCTSLPSPTPIYHCFHRNRDSISSWNKITQLFLSIIMIDIIPNIIYAVNMKGWPHSNKLTIKVQIIITPS